MNGLTKRGGVRLISFMAASVAVLVTMTAVSEHQREQYKRQLEFTYMRALQDTADLVSGISVTLDKGLHAGTTAQMGVLSATLWRDAGAAKASLSSLPLSGFDLGGAYRFLSQVGDYSMALTKTRQAGQALSDEERETLLTLRDYAGALDTRLSAIQAGVAQGALTLDSIVEEAASARTPASVESNADAGPLPGSGFLELEESFSGYPTLIYDGPFSDHLLNREPSLTQGAPEITREAARAIAAAGAMAEPGSLMDGADEASRLPSYTFTQGEDTSVAVTKNGGFLVYMVDGRLPGAAALDGDTARERALEYLGLVGLGNLNETYSEKSGNILTINFAYRQSDVLCYTDLVKVGVALDNGEILLFDARGYIMNHHSRTPAAPEITAEQAARSIAANLETGASRLALIPTSGQNEALCYEFYAVDDNGGEFLVYINAKTGAEEQILKLIVSDEGVLTR